MSLAAHSPCPPLRPPVWRFVAVRQLSLFTPSVQPETDPAASAGLGPSAICHPQSAICNPQSAISPPALASLLAYDPPAAAVVLAALNDAQRLAQARAQSRLPTRQGTAADPAALLDEWASLIRAAADCAPPLAPCDKRTA